MAEAIQGLSIGLGLDTAGLDVGLKQLKGKLSLVNSEMKANMSAFDRGEKSVGKYETQLTGLNKKLELQKTAASAAKTEYEKMVAQHGEGSRQADRAAVAFNNEVAAVNNLERYVGDLSEEFRNFQQEQEAANSGFGRLSSSLESMGGKFSAVGDKMTSAGKGLSMGLTVPIAAFGAAGVVAFNEVDEAIDTVITKTGATGDAAEVLTENFRTVAKRVPDDLLSVGEAIGEVNTQFGFMGKELEDASQLMLEFANINGTDVTSSSIASKQAIEAYGLANSDLAGVLDAVTQTAQDTGQSVDDLFDKATKGAPQIKALGLNFADGTALIGGFEKAGVDSSAALSSLSKAQVIFAKDGKTLEEGLNSTVDSIMNAKSETEALTIASEVFGTKGGPRMVDAIQRGTFNLEDFTGASEKAAGAVKDTFNETVDPIDQAAIAMNNAKLAMAEVGEVLQVAALPFMEKATEVMGTLADKFRGLSPEAKNTALVIGGIAAAAGPVLVVLGSLASGIGAIITFAGSAAAAVSIMGTGVAAATPLIGGLATAFTVLTGPIGIAVAAVAGIGIATGLLVKHFREDAIPEVDRFGEGVSESTQKALGSFFELSDGASQSLMDMRINGLEVTELMADELLVKYEDMNDQILNSMEARYKEENMQLKTFFENSSVLTEEEEAKAFDSKVSRQQAAIKVQQSHEDEIQRIVKLAATEKRELTESELLQIDTLHQQMNESAVVYLSENEMEQKVIMERMLASADELSAQQAAAVTKNSADARDKVIADAETKFNDTVAMAIRERDETGSITAEQAQKIIDEATKAKDGAVLKAEEMHAGVVSEAKLQAGEHVAEVDWQTGEILSKWDVYKAGVVKRFKETNAESIEDFKTFGTRFDEEWTLFNDKAKLKVDEWKAGVKKRFTETNAESLADFQRWGTNFNDGWNNFNERAKEKVATYKSNVKQRFHETNAESLGDFKRWGTNFNDAWNNFNNGAKAKVDDYKAGVKKRFRETNADSLADFKRWGGNIKDWATDAKNGIMKTFDNLVQGAKNLPGRIGSGISSMASKVSDGVKSVSNKLASGLGTGVNGVINGINWVLKRIGVGESGYVDNWTVPKYAHGTDGHKGGLAILGDGRGANSGRELIKTPSGELGLSPATDTLMNLPKGTQILSATKTRELLGDIPKYNQGNSSISDFFGGLYKGAKDFGSNVISGGKKTLGKVKDAAFDVWDHVSNPGKLLSMALSMLGISAPAGGSFVGNMAKGGYNKVKSLATSFLKGKIDNAGIQAGSGHGFGSAFRLTSKRGFRINPVTGIGQMHQGDDWGARLGTLIPAQAAGKVIQAGFHGIRGNYVRIQSGIMDRLYQHNQRNLVRVGQNVRKGQAVGTVGSTGRSTGPHLHYEVRRNGMNINPAGLATGGITNQEQLVRISEGNREEITIPMHKSRRTDAMKLLAIAGKKLMPGGDKGITRPNQLPNVSNDSDGDGVLKQLLAATMKQNEILLQLLNKPSDVVMDTGALVGAIGDSVDTNLGNKSSRNGYFEGLR